MATSELVLPQLGETVTEGTITRWFKGPGERIEVDEVFYEVSTEKVDSEVPSPMSGIVTEILVPEGDTVDVGTVLALVETEGEQPAAQSGSAAQLAPPPVVAASAQVATSQVESGSVGPAPIEPDGRLLSPLVRRLIRENGLDVDQLVGTGAGNRITRADVLNVIDKMRLAGGAAPEDRPAAALAATPSPGAPGPDTKRAVGAPVPGTTEWDGQGSRFEPFNKVRQLTGKRMVESLSVSAHVLTVMEVDYENVDQVRRAQRERWKQEGFSLTYLPFIVLSVANALTDWPNLNATVVEENSVAGLRVYRQLNIGVAVDLSHQGLIVPVLQQAGTLNLRGAARAINDLAERARHKKLRPDDISGGTFTISNNGSFGTYTTAAIINQPQVGVLSTDGVARRPVVSTDEFGNESIVVHSVGHLALSWDHRAFDGAYAAGFLGSVKAMLETHDWAAEF